MASTATGQENDPHDVLEIETILAGARTERGIPTLVPQGEAPASPAAAESVAAAPRVDTTFRAATAGTMASRRTSNSVGRWTLRTILGLSVAVSTAVAAAAWQNYGDRAKEIVATLSPYVSEAWSMLAPRPDSADTSAAKMSSQSPVQAPAQPAVEAQPAGTVAPTVAVQSPDSTELLQSVAHDLAEMSQQVQELKAGLEQLKAGQEQMARDIAKASVEPNLRAKAAIPPAPSVASPRKPRPGYPPARTAIPPLPRAAAAPLAQQPAMPVAPQQPTPRFDDEPVLRPPLPMR